MVSCMMASDPTSSTRKPVLGVSVCVWRDGKVLMIKRGKAPSKGLWAPVGGHLEWGETLAEAARREVLEETSVDCDIVGFSQLREVIQRGSEAIAGYHVVLAVFAARWAGGEPKAGDDAAEAGWFSPADLGTLPLVPGVVPYIEATRALIDAGV